MMHAYDEMYLSKAQQAMGDMLHFAVHDLKWDIEKFYAAFIFTGLAESVKNGNPKYVVGMSGYELAYEVYFRLTGAECKIKPNYVYGKSPEYFAGWAVAYYSWYRNISFSAVERVVPIKDIVTLYVPYHEMDIMQFVDHIDERMSQERKETTLKRLRLYAELTQKELAEKTGVSQRMIEQYEQNRKDLSHASVITVIKLANALSCDVNDLISVN